MKRTEKDIYDFTKKKLLECDEMLRHKREKPLPILKELASKEMVEIRAKREAYEEVLNFIGTIITKGE